MVTRCQSCTYRVIVHATFYTPSNTPTSATCLALTSALNISNSVSLSPERYLAADLSKTLAKSRLSNARRVTRCLRPGTRRFGTDVIPSLPTPRAGRLDSLVIRSTEETGTILTPKNIMS